jgi:hypothetical protein
MIMMQRILILLVLAGTLFCVGCDKQHKISEFTPLLKPDLTAEQLESTVGSPSKRDAHWVAYALDDGNELRVYFFGGHGTKALTRRL